MKKLFAIISTAVLAIGLSAGAMAGPPGDAHDQGNSGPNAHGGNAGNANGNGNGNGGDNPNKGPGNNSGENGHGLDDINHDQKH